MLCVEETQVVERDDVLMPGREPGEAWTREPEEWWRGLGYPSGLSVRVLNVLDPDDDDEKDVDDDDDDDDLLDDDPDDDLDDDDDDDDDQDDDEDDDF